jgi:hypothetical protein
MEPVSKPELVGRPARVQRQHEHAEPEPEREHHADHGVALALAQAQHAEHHPGDDGPGHCSVLDTGADEQGGRPAGERQLRGAVHGERHPTRDDERRQCAGDQPEHRAGDQRGLHERERQQPADPLEREDPSEQFHQTGSSRQCSP